MDVGYILSQVFTVIMYVLLVFTYFAKNKRKVVIACNLAILCNAAAFIFLRAWSGLAVCAIDLLRNFYMMWEEKKFGKKKRSLARRILFPTIVYSAMAVAAYFTYEGPLSLFSVFASGTYAFSIMQKNLKVYKFCGLPVGILWIIYNSYIGSFFGVVLEAALLIASVIGFIREITKKPKRRRR